MKCGDKHCVASVSLPYINITKHLRSYTYKFKFAVFFLFAVKQHELPSLPTPW